MADDQHVPGPLPAPAGSMATAAETTVVYAAPAGSQGSAPGAPPGELRMPFLAHLGELRKRLLWGLSFLLAASLLAFSFAPQLFVLLQWPLSHVPNVQMVVLSPLEMFSTYMKLALLVGLLVSAPWLLLQLWLFVAPGLYPSERRFAVPFVLLGSACFVGGAAFCFYLVLPASFAYLVEMVPSTVQAQYSVALYFSLVVQMTLAFGAIFELPLVMMLLGVAGVVTTERYAAFRKYWIVLAAIIGGIVTPTPDPMTQLMMAVPLILFYELGIVGTRFLRKQHRVAAHGAL